MRKKAGSNHGKKSVLSRIFGKSSRSVEDSDWVVLDAVADEALPSKPRKRQGQSWLIRSLAIVCLFVSIPLGAKWAYDNIFYKNEEFILQRLDVQSDGALQEGKLLEIANVTRGMNLLELDLTAIQDQIEKLPQVEKATANRELPDRLTILVRERVPLAWISCPPQGIRPWDMERGFLIDSEGILFRCLDLTEGLKALPVIEAFRMVQPLEGEKMTTAGVDAALELIESADMATVGDGLAIALVKLKNEWSVECAYRDGLVVTFDNFEVERGLRDLALILEQTKVLEQSVATVNVVSTKNIPITFAGEIAPDVLSAAKQRDHTDSPETESTSENVQEKHLQSILNGG